MRGSGVPDAAFAELLSRVPADPALRFLSASPSTQLLHKTALVNEHSCAGRRAGEAGDEFHLHDVLP